MERGERRGNKTDGDGMLDMRRKKEERIVELQRKRRALEMWKREGQKQLVNLVSPLGQLLNSME